MKIVPEREELIRISRLFEEVVWGTFTSRLLRLLGVRRYFATRWLIQMILESETVEDAEDAVDRYFGI